MAAGKQYYKYKRKAELLDELMFDIETILVNNGMDFVSKDKLLTKVYWKYKEELKK